MSGGLTMTVHSKIGASSCKRWKACPGSVRLSAGMPSYSSSFAEEGTAAHELAEKILRQGESVDVAADGEMLSHVNLYTNYVLALGGELLVEHKFHLKNLHDGLFGTADAVVWDEGSKTLHVIDLKYGAGVAVEAKDNDQLLYYATGALLETKRPAKKVVMTIVQPRCFHSEGPIRSAEIDALDLLDWAADLVEAAKATEAEDAPLVSGEHCRWCPAAAICPNLLEKAQATAKFEFRQDLSYDPKTLAEALELADVVETWVSSVRSFAYQEADRGRSPPGWKLVDKRATRRWRDEQQAMTLLFEYGLDDPDLFERKMRTPAAIEKLIGKDGKELLDNLTTKESSGTTLARESDSRPSAKASAQEDFS